MRVYHTSVNWWFSTGGWGTGTLLKSPGLFLVFNNVVLWMIFTHPLIFKSSTPYTNPFVTIIIGVIVTIMFHNFFSSLARSRYLSLFSLSDSFTLLSTRSKKSTIRQVLFLSFFLSLFLFIYLFIYFIYLFFFWLSLGLVVWPTLDDPFVSQNPKEFCTSHFLRRIQGCAYTIYYYCIRSGFFSVVVTCGYYWGQSNRKMDPVIYITNTLRYYFVHTSLTERSWFRHFPLFWLVWFGFMAYQPL